MPSPSGSGNGGIAAPRDPPVMDMIRQYTEDWKRNPPDPDFRKFVSGAVSRRSDLLDDAHRPLTLEEYRQALKKCEEMLQDEEKEWEVLNPLGRSYMRATSERHQLLLGEARWSQLDSNSKFQLKGGKPGTDSSWWGLLGRMARSNGKAVWDHEAKIRRILDKVVSADDTEFPDVAVAALQELTSIDYVAHGTATLLLTLARPDRLLSLNGRVREGVWQAIWDEPFDPRRASKLSQAASMALRPALVCRFTADGWSLGENLAVPRCSRGCVRLRTDVASCSASFPCGSVSDSMSPRRRLPQLFGSGGLKMLGCDPPRLIWIPVPRLSWSGLPREDRRGPGSVGRRGSPAVGCPACAVV